MTKDKQKTRQPRKDKKNTFLRNFEQQYLLKWIISICKNNKPSIQEIIDLIIFLDNETTLIIFLDNETTLMSEIILAYNKHYGSNYTREDIEKYMVLL